MGLEGLQGGLSSFKERLASDPRRSAVLERRSVTERVAAQFRSVAFLVFALASFAHAEVMDKEPTVTNMWTAAAMFGIAGAAAWVWRAWLGCLASCITLFFAWGMYAELADPFVGRDILQEAGPAYVRHTYASVAASIAPHLGAIVFRFWKHRRAAPIDASA
jgi:hypothetical protein